MENFEQFVGTLDNNEIGRIKILLEKAFSKKFDIDYLKWLYIDNPNGKAITYNISDKDKIVGHYAIIPTVVLLDNKKYKAALSLNTAVDINYRGKGFFKKMAEKTYSEAKRSGINFIFGISNQQSTSLFLKYLNFQDLGQLDVKIGFGNVKDTINRKKIEFFWDKRSLKWRVKNPRYKYKFMIKNDKFLIFNRIYKIINIFMGEYNLNEMEIVEKEKSIFNFVNLYIGLGKKNLKKSFYFNIPNFLKPSPLNLIFKDISDNKKKLLLNREDVLIQLLDFDAF